MPYISFSEKDRTRLQVEEWLEFHPADISIRDLQELSEICDFDPTDWPGVFWGEIPLSQAGNPDAQRVAPKWQIQATAWMTLRQNGIPVSWDDAGSIQAGWIRWANEKPGAEPEPSPGKGTGKPSPKRAASTTQSSATSTRRSRSAK